MEAGQAGSLGDGQSEARVLWALSVSSSLSAGWEAEECSQRGETKGSPCNGLLGVHGGTLEHLRLPGFSSDQATADHSQEGLLSSLGFTLSSVKWENSTCFPGLNEDQHDPRLRPSVH